MAGMRESALNRAAAATVQPVTHVAIYAGDPDAAGTRVDTQEITYGAADGGAVQSEEVVFEVPAETTVTHVAHYAGDPDAAGTIENVDPLPTPETYGGAGTYRYQYHRVEITQSAE